MRTLITLCLTLICLGGLTACQSPEQIHDTQVRNIKIIADSIDRKIPLTRSIPVALPSHVTSTVDVFGNLDHPDRLQWNWEFNGVKTVKNYYFENGVIILYTYKKTTKRPDGQAPGPKDNYELSTYFTDDDSRKRDRFPEGEQLDRLLSQTHADKIKLRTPSDGLQAN